MSENNVEVKKVTLRQKNSHMERSNMKPNTFNSDKTVQMSDWDVWLDVLCWLIGLNQFIIFSAVKWFQRIRDYTTVISQTKKKKTALYTRMWAIKVWCEDTLGDRCVCRPQP